MCRRRKKRYCGTDRDGRGRGAAGCRTRRFAHLADGHPLLQHLFDENAASHIALGRAYANCIAGWGLSDEVRRPAATATSSRRLHDRLDAIDIDG
jgi:leucyl aminopeptidase (aminopeptidase T)